MAQIKLILEALIALPKLVAQLREALSFAQNARDTRELEQKKDELNTLATQLIGAASNEERRDLVRRINSIQL
jgi:hypothetical protein